MKNPIPLSSCCHATMANLGWCSCCDRSCKNVYKFENFTVTTGSIYTFTYKYKGVTYEGSGRFGYAHEGKLFFAEENVHRDFWALKPEDIVKISQP